MFFITLLKFFKTSSSDSAIDDTFSDSSQRELEESQKSFSDSIVGDSPSKIDYTELTHEFSCKEFMNTNGQIKPISEILNLTLKEIMHHI